MHRFQDKQQQNKKADDVPNLNYISTNGLIICRSKLIKKFAKNLDFNGITVRLGNLTGRTLFLVVDPSDNVIATS
jgi:hypothetical protein